MTTGAEAGTAAARRGSRVRLMAVPVAVAAALAVHLATALAGVDLAVGQGADLRQIGPLATVATSGIATALAMLLLAWLGDRPGGRTVWTVVAVAVFVLSLAGPTGAPTGAATFALSAMHTVVAVVVFAAAWIDGRQRRAPGTAGGPDGPPARGGWTQSRP